MGFAVETPLNFYLCGHLYSLCENLFEGIFYREIISL